MGYLSDRLLNNLRVRLPGATDGAIRQELWNVLDEACRVGGLWREIIEIELNQTATEYPLSPPVGAEVVHILDVKHMGLPVSSSANGSESPVITMRGRIEADNATADTFTFNPDAQGQSSIGGYAIYDPQYITITNTADEVAIKFPLLVAVTLAPAIDVIDQDLESWVPESFWSKHYHLALDGTLGNMMSQIAKPYSSERMAMYHLKRFRNFMSFGRVGAEKGGQPRTQSWRFPRWA